ncbi:MAG TPA: PQ-loop domain-containing transporter, partial [Coxiellaceae bacterium]|nr:PQ-loop domain-containing transporter [Coxiellaceae bacterium]
MSLWITRFVEVIFSLGLLFNIILFIPQAVKIYKKKEARDLSLITFMGFNVMQFFTAWHGYLVKDYLLMFGFAFSFLTCGVVTLL